MRANSKATQHKKTSSAAARPLGNEDAKLEAAHRRLQETMDQADALEAVREIVTNLLGCEEIGLFALKGVGSELFWSFGIDPERHRTLASFKEFALAEVLDGKVQVVRVGTEGDEAHHTAPARAFIPLSLNGRTVAVLVMLKLLPQKVGFDEADVRLVTLLSHQAGKALFGRTASAGA